MKGIKLPLYKELITQHLSQLSYFIIKNLQKIWSEFRWLIIDKSQILIALCICMFLRISLTNADYLNSFFIAENISSFLLTVGGSLIGFTAIVFSMLLFSLQTNIQRLRYIDFYNFSTDYKIFSLLFSCFIIAISITFTSINISENIGQTIVITWWLILLFTYLLYLSYKRALTLVNPVQQINIIVNKSLEKHQKWEAIIELSISKNKNPPPKTHQFRVDQLRYSYIQNLPNQDYISINAVDSLCQIAKFYSGSGDINIANLALSAINNITNQYIQVRKNTFIENSLIINSNLNHEAVFTNTFEKLRQLSSYAISNENEQLINSISKTFSSLLEGLLKAKHIYKCELNSQISIVIEYLNAHLTSSYKINKTDMMFKDTQVVGELGHNIIKYGSQYDLEIPNKLLFKYAEKSIKDKSLILISSVMEKYSQWVAHILLSENANQQQLQLITININKLGKLVSQSDTLYTLNSGYFSGYYSTTHNSFMNLIQRQINYINDETYNDDKTSRFTNNILNWLEQSFPIRLEQFKFDQEYKCNIFSALLLWEYNLIKLLQFLSVTINGVILKEKCNKIIQKEIDYLFSLQSNMCVYRVMKSYKYLDKIFNILMAHHSTSIEIIESKIAKILKIGLIYYNESNDHTEFVKCITASAAIALKYNITENYREKMIKLTSKLKQKITTPAIHKLEFLSMLKPHKITHTSSEIEEYCLSHPTEELKELLLFSIIVLTEKSS